MMHRQLSPKLFRDKGDPLTKSRPFQHATQPPKNKVEAKPAVKAVLPMGAVSPASRSGQNNSATNYKSHKNVNSGKTAATVAVFDDYYGTIPRLQPSHKKDDDSLSGDSYQSEGLGFKKIDSSLKPPPTRKMATGSSAKNLLASHSSKHDSRSSFKSPGSNRDDDKSSKRILSFGQKKAAGLQTRRLEDLGKDSKKTSTGNYQSPIRHFPGLNISEQDRGAKGKEPTSKGNTKKILHKGMDNIKSSPYLPITPLDSSNQLSSDRARPEDPCKLEPLLQQLKADGSFDSKPMRFNPGEMFLNLKQRQERHSQLCRELKMVGTHVDLRTVGGRKERMFLLKKINQSKNTTILVAAHERTQSLYCLKRVAIQDSHSNISEVVRENKIHQSCSHPHIVRSFASAVEGRFVYLIMEFMEEESLGQQVRAQLIEKMSEQSPTRSKINGSLTSQITKVNKVRRVLFEVGQALNYLHSRRIIHRDIKPDNIFVSHENYKLGDFGSACVGTAPDYVGTLDYAAPEVLSQGPFDCKVDVWSLGCIAYEMAVGRPPFYHIKPEQTRRLVLRGEYDSSLVRDWPLKALIDRMLTVDPCKRISVGEMLRLQFFEGVAEKDSFF